MSIRTALVTAVLLASSPAFAAPGSIAVDIGSIANQSVAAQVCVKQASAGSTIEQVFAGALKALVEAKGFLFGSGAKKMCS